MVNNTAMELDGKKADGLEARIRGRDKRRASLLMAKIETFLNSETPLKTFKDLKLAADVENLFRQLAKEDDKKDGRVDPRMQKLLDEQTNKYTGGKTNVGSQETAN